MLENKEKQKEQKKINKRVMNEQIVSRDKKKKIKDRWKKITKREEEKVQQKIKHGDNNTLKLYQGDKVNLMFNAATDRNRHFLCIFYDLYIINKQITYNEQRGTKGEGKYWYYFPLVLIILFEIFLSILRHLFKSACQLIPTIFTKIFCLHILVIF